LVKNLGVSSGNLALNTSTPTGATKNSARSGYVIKIKGGNVHNMKSGGKLIKVPAAPSSGKALVGSTKSGGGTMMIKEELQPEIIRKNIG